MQRRADFDDEKTRTKTIMVIRSTPPRTAPNMIHLVLQGEESTLKATVKAFGDEDLSIEAVLFLQSLDLLIELRLVWLSLLQPWPFCTMRVFVVLLVIEVTSISLFSMFAHPSTEIEVEVPERKSFETFKFPCTITVVYCDGMTKFGVSTLPVVLATVPLQKKFTGQALDAVGGETTGSVTEILLLYITVVYEWSTNTSK